MCLEVRHQVAVMDEMDLPQMKKEVESLKYQLAFKREKSSKTVTEWVVSQQVCKPQNCFAQMTKK